MNEKELHLRYVPEQEMHQIVNCPYEWIRLTPGTQINPRNIARRILKTRGCIDCAGPACVIYPCQRVREFAGVE